MKNILTFAIMAALSWTAKAQEASYSFDLKELREQFELKATDVYLANSISFSKKHDWFNGVIGNEKLGQLALKPVGNADAVSRGLKLSFDYAAGAPSAELCNDFYRCKPTELKNNRKKYTLSSPGSTWELSVHGHPCKNTKTCDLKIPSWALETMRIHGGSMRSFPETLTVVYHKMGLAFINAATGKFLFNIHLDAQRKPKGRFEIRALEETVTLIQSSNLAVVIDWLGDRAFRVDSTGIYRSTAGVLGLNENSSEKVADFQPSATRKFVGLNDKFIVMSDMILEWNLSSKAPVKIGSESFLKIGDKAVSFTSSNDYSNILMRSGQLFKLAELKTASQWNIHKTFSYKGKGSFDLFGQNVYHFGKSGLKILEGKSMKNTSLSKEGKSVFMSDHRNAFIQNISKNNCKWQHFQSHTKHRESLSGSGVSIDCGLFNGFSSNGEIVSLTAFQGNKVQVSTYHK